LAGEQAKLFSNGYGPLTDILMGVSGAVAGGLVMPSVGLGGATEE